MAAGRATQEQVDAAFQRAATLLQAGTGNGEFRASDRTAFQRAATLLQAGTPRNEVARVLQSEGWSADAASSILDGVGVAAGRPATDPAARADDLIVQSPSFRAFLREAKQPGEDVVAATPAHRNHAPMPLLAVGTFVVTTRRLVYYNRGGLFRAAVEESLVYRQLTSITFEMDSAQTLKVVIDLAGKSYSYDCRPSEFGFGRRSMERKARYKAAIMQQLNAAGGGGAPVAAGRTTKARLQEIAELLREGHIGEADYQQMRAAILADA